jgi:hypothetical protein
MSQTVACDLCGRELATHESFIARIDLFADPSMPPVSAAELETMASPQVMQALLEQMKHMSTEELQDGVHRRFEFRLCPVCHRQVLTNPLGKPRGASPGAN